MTNNILSKPFKQATVGVIIPTIGRATLESCLQAIQRQTRPPDEVIVVHDRERKGAAQTRNEGIARSTSEYLAFTDDDCVPPDPWLENLMTVMDQQQADVVGGTLQESDPFLDSIQKRRIFPQSTGEDHTGHVGNTANILYKRCVLERCLEKDGYVFKGLGEDIELIWRLRQQGARIIYTTETVLHLRRYTPVSYLRHQFIRGISIACLYKFYYQTRTSFISQPSLLWGNEEIGFSANWLKVIWLKAIGPFDVKSFPSAGYFLMFWLGEKARGLGFLWGMFLDKHH